MSSPITASVVFPVDMFRRFISLETFRSMSAEISRTKGRTPDQFISLSFPDVGLMAVSRRYFSTRKRIFKKTNLELCGKRLRFRKTQTKHIIWKLDESVEQQIDCFSTGELPSLVVLPGYEVQDCFKHFFKNFKRAWCQLDVTDKIVQLRAAHIVAAITKEDEPNRAAIAVRHDDGLYLINRWPAGAMD